jgi:hypothetical protein
MSISCKQNDVNDDIIKFWMKFVIKDFLPNHMNTVYVSQICDYNYNYLVTYQKLPHGNL